MLSEQELADILTMTRTWVRNHAGEIPGFERFGNYYRFRRTKIEQWLGSLDQLLQPEQVAALLGVPCSWIYTNADQIPGVLRLGRYVRFRPAIIAKFLRESKVVQ